jgi:ABC-type nitrate/sulfonate/bicarbonate transport system substrate-binding protein
MVDWQWIKRKERDALFEIGRKTMPPMQMIDLTFVGRGIHEELTAYVADQQGYFEDEGVHVAIRDGIKWKDERVRAGATIGLGRSLLARLTDGVQWKVLTVNTHRPLFWFLGGRDVKSMEDLRGRRLAIHSPKSAPGCFARLVLRKHGLDPDRDVKCIVRHPGDYQMDLRHLRDGSFDAAYVGSTLGPEQIAAEEGFSVLAWVGDHFQIPTVGIAVDHTRIPLDNQALQALVRANRRALVAIAEQPQLAIDYMSFFLGRMSHDEIQRYYERYIGPYFNSHGRVDMNVAQQAVDAVATELGVASFSADEMYQPAL